MSSVLKSVSLLNMNVGIFFFSAVLKLLNYSPLNPGLFKLPNAITFNIVLLSTPFSLQILR